MIQIPYIVTAFAATPRTNPSSQASAFFRVERRLIRERDGPGHVVNKLGEIIQTGIKPGTRVRVYYANMGDLRMVDHVVVLD